MERRLAAILAADVVGYSRLMGADETTTLERLQSLFKEVVQPEVRRGGGRIVKLMGDGLLAEFPSVIAAVSCAVEIQKSNQKRESDSPPDQKIALRIGINLGDILVKDGDIYGDGVNIAARLEALAEASGICLSGPAFDTVDGKLDYAFGDMGKVKLKNISKPVQVYALSPQATSSVSKEEIATTIAASEKASIAILPFSNMRGDAEMEMFCEGLSEDIITGLSRFRTLSVVTRKTSHDATVSSGQNDDGGKQPTAQFNLEGSVRSAGSRVRISTQLTETATGNQIWAERYDRDLEDVFAVQDEVCQAIVAVLPGRIQHAVADRAARKPTNEMKAYELLLQAKALRDGLNAEDTLKARQLLEKALEIDSRMARSYMYLADTYVIDLWLGLAEDGAADQALEIARKGAALDNKDVYIQDQLGYAFLCARLWQDAEVQFEETLSNIVNEAESMAWCGYGFLLLGRHERAKEVVQEAIRLDPLHPPALDWILGQVHFFEGRYDAVIRVLIGEALLNSLARAFLVAAYAHSGRQEEARLALKAFIKHRREELASRNIHVDSDSTQTLAQGFASMWRREEDWNLLLDGLRTAGLQD